MGRLSHKRGRPSKYRKSLHGWYWNEVKRKIRLRDKYRCVVCGNRLNLEVHHIAYKVGGISILGKELEHLEWLALVCEDCHQAIHKNTEHPLNPKNFHKQNMNEYGRH